MGHAYRRLRHAGVLALLLPLASCGYSLAGRGSFLPEYIKVIGVPNFTNATTVYDVERRVSERIRQEFIGRGKYSVKAEATGIDALLTGEITSITLVPSAFNDQRQATRYGLTLTARVEFKDVKTGKILLSNPAVSFREEYEITSTASADPATFLGQDANALDRLSQDLAKAIVSAVFEAF